MRHRLADAIVVIAVVVWGLFGGLAANDLVGGDEGYYATMARNLLAEGSQWAKVSLSPLGEAGDKPPLVPALLALATLLFGFSETALRTVPLLSTAFAMLAATRLGERLAPGRGAIITALLLATLPWLADGARVVSAEPTLAAFGLWALVLLTGDPLSPKRAAMAGVLLGLAFQCKTWLVVLVALPAAAALIGHSRRTWLAVGAGAAAASMLHLVVVLVLTPRDLAHWVNVILRFSLASRAGGEGFASYWLQPPTFYVRMLAQALLLWSPLLAIGVIEAWRRRREPTARVLLGALASLLLLSAFRVKSGGYLHPLVPLAAVLAALGAHALGERSGYRGIARAAAVTFVAIAVVAGAWRVSQRLPQRYHDPGYREVAAFLAPALASAAPSDTVLIAPEAPVFQALLFRTTDYWDTPYRPWTEARAARLMAGTGPSWFVVDPGGRLYGGRPDSATIAWLETQTREVTEEVVRASGRDIEVRVFERR